MPSTQIFVSRELKAREYTHHIHEIQDRINALILRRNVLTENVHVLRHAYIRVDDEQRKFVRKCPINECRGYFEHALEMWFMSITNMS